MTDAGIKKKLDVATRSAWAAQKVRYSRAKRGRNERGATLGQCALIAAVALNLGR